MCHAAEKEFLDEALALRAHENERAAASFARSMIFNAGCPLSTSVSTEACSKLRAPFETLAVDLPAFLLHLEGNVELR
ncbi:MAG: hypothetical protein WA376_22415 [Terrimicrobiaceae bacterium]